MMPWRCGPEQLPGDLFFDPDLPDAERVVVSCGTWTAQATHVWTGTGWSRLLTVPVRHVPGARVTEVQGTVDETALAPRLAS